jgi:kexin
MFNHKFGYGLLDGYRIVEAAKTHKLVNRQTKFDTGTIDIHQEIPENDEGIRKTVSISESDLNKVEFRRLEHVTVTMDISHSRRGDVNVFLQSPNGYVSEVIVGRPYDEDMSGFPGWTAMTVKHWYAS